MLERETPPSSPLDLPVFQQQHILYLRWQKAGSTQADCDWQHSVQSWMLRMCPLQEELAAAYAALEVADKRAAELQSELEQAAASHPEVKLLVCCHLAPAWSAVLHLPCTKGAPAGP